MDTDQAAKAIENKTYEKGREERCTQGKNRNLPFLIFEIW
ncbi:hypothetical protein THOE12_180004 [Vibrio rotiferianus]|nr:hypothetical protein THOE12_180004 [Vibrio rotiferianus]